MYRAFIIDDEPAVIDGLKLMIHWDALGFELCGEAMDSQEAYDKIVLLRPHLVVMDVRMPKRSGLNLISDLRKLDIDTEYIILSGHPEFTYVQEAIRLNVRNYLLKPLDTHEFSAALREIKSLLDKKFFVDMEYFDNSDERLKEAVLLMNCPDAMLIIDELFETFISQGIKIPQAQMIVNSAVYQVLGAAYERNIKLEFILPKIDNTELCTISSLRRYITGIVSRVIIMLRDERKKNARLYLKEVKQYIDEHYDSEITVSMLAEMVYIDAEYLGKLFIKE
jgi:two-component system response regulator YesN